MLWWTPTEALPFERSEWNAMSMPSLGDNVESDGASVLMFFQSQSLIVPLLTSSFCWEERGLRCAVVCGSTHLRSVVRRRCCERSQGQHHPHRVVVALQCGCRRHRACRRAAGNTCEQCTL